MLTAKAWKPRGVLNLKTGQTKFQLTQHRPSEKLAFFIDYYWIVNWDLRGQEPYLAENLSHPCVHLVFEKGRTRIVGVVKGKFAQLLEGKGRVFGVRFRPGAFYPLLGSPVCHFTNSSLSFHSVFGSSYQALEHALLTLEDETRMVALVEAFLAEHLPAEHDHNIERISQIINRISFDRTIMTVDDLANSYNLSKRALQRLFSQYVGVNPKWVIQRYRLHEVTELLEQAETVDWVKLAVDLGYFDQAHFIKDFKMITGCTPGEYLRRAVQTNTDQTSVISRDNAK